MSFQDAQIRAYSCGNVPPPNTYQNEYDQAVTRVRRANDFQDFPQNQPYGHQQNHPVNPQQGHAYPQNRVSDHPRDCVMRPPCGCNDQRDTRPPCDCTTNPKMVALTHLITHINM